MKNRIIIVLIMFVVAFGVSYVWWYFDQGEFPLGQFFSGMMVAAFLGYRENDKKSVKDE